MAILDTFGCGGIPPLCTARGIVGTRSHRHVHLRLSAAGISYQLGIRRPIKFFRTRVCVVVTEIASGGHVNRGGKCVPAGRQRHFQLISRIGSAQPWT